MRLTPDWTLIVLLLQNLTFRGASTFINHDEFTESQLIEERGPHAL